MRCPDLLCEGTSRGCACALRVATEPLGTFHLYRNLISQPAPRRYGPGDRLSWNGIRCWWFHSEAWIEERELEDVNSGRWVAKHLRPTASLNPDVDMLCVTCSGKITTHEDWIVR